MLKIAICDDLSRERETVKNILTSIQINWDIDFNIKSFSSGEELIDALTKEYFDIILLDIVMGGMDGVETASKIRSLGLDCLIIFLSGCDERLRELFDFRTIGFVDKPANIEYLEKYLRRAYQIINKDERNFVYEKKGIKNQVKLNNIVWFESERYKIKLTTINDTIYYSGSLKDVWETIKEENDFILLNKSFIVNLKFGEMISTGKFRINPFGLEVSVGRIFKEDTLERYLKYIKRGL